ncbi:twin-arginine translocation signal domain-containing protein (plasmid) [Halorussus salilacus]|uniref:twin-arginine translocation signal domain-containing protein n=1 Tax=Halorussus salilacus TaxID=2953750 RepID=UPI00209D8040|nr:twin-arginine translocation signal domain-containing protein [Halorussus salilacus]USZ69911.1 twin-arginine translocation signal domain-containing protein [Halorussus salilacus]
MEKRNTPDSSQRAHSNTSRRDFLRTTGVVTGAAVTGLGTLASGPSLVFASKEEPYDRTQKSVVERLDEDWCELQSNINGAKMISQETNQFEQAGTFAISRTSVEGAYANTRNVRFDLDAVDVPDTGYWVNEHNAYKQDDDDSEVGEQLVEEAASFLWDVTLSSLGAPNPLSLLLVGDDDNSVSVDTGCCNDYLHVSYPKNTDVGGIWVSQYFQDEDTQVPEGTYKFEATFEADVGHVSTSTLDPGFQKKETVTHDHDIEVEVYSD